MGLGTPVVTLVEHRPRNVSTSCSSVISPAATSFVRPPPLCRMAAILSSSRSTASRSGIDLQTYRVFPSIDLYQPSRLGVRPCARGATPL